MLRIAIPLIGGSQWRGGRNYMINLLQGLRDVGTGRVQPVLFLGLSDDLGDDDLGSIEGIEVIRSDVFNQSRKQKRLARALLTGTDQAAAELFSAHAISCAFETAQFYGWRFPISVLAWMPDFQHRHMPQLFSKLAWWKRDLGFRAQVMSRRQIMLSSHDAQNDCERFYPHAKGRTCVVRFATPVPNRIEESVIQEVCRRYDLPTNYIFLPNQFWSHKNHEVVIRALMALSTRNVQICVVASGHTADPRAPQHFNMLQRLVIDNNLQNNFRILGAIPYCDVQALLQGCSALINPSYFEGWSTTVEEAKASGVPLILSDLNVHREQAGNSAVYFNPNYPDNLAELLEHSTPQIRIEQDRLSKMADERRRQFIEAFETAVLASVEI